MTIYDRIKQKRIELGISQQELADKLNYSSRSSIAKIEGGDVDISHSKIIEFAKALNVTPAYLMGWEEELKQEPKKELTIDNINMETLSTYNDRSLTEEEQVKLHEYAKFLKLQRMRENE